MCALRYPFCLADKIFIQVIGKPSWVKGKVVEGQVTQLVHFRSQVVSAHTADDCPFREGIVGSAIRHVSAAELDARR